MKISEIKLCALEIPMKKTFKTSRAQQKVAKHLIVQILTGDGLVGVGEAAPRPHITGENLESVFAVLERSIGPVLIGEDPINLYDLHKRMDLATELNTSAKCAIDLALHDLIGKSFGIPVYDLMGGKTKKRLHTNYICDINEPERVSEILERKVKEGFTYSVKIKVGTDPLKDVERVRAAREAIGPEMNLIADANQGWDPATAIRVLRKMEDFDLRIAEQPVYWEDLMGLAKVTRAVRLAVMADESVWSPFDALQIIRMEAAHMLNIKLIKSAGLLEAQQIAMLARSANMSCMVGSTIETSILCAAEGHFAMAHENVRYIDPLRPHEYLKEDPAKGVRWEKDLLILSDRAGLGIELDQKVMDKYKTRETTVSGVH
jgi:L-alanine-DL-glutamate epimerase-like enolase superfamily enzyme